MPSIGEALAALIAQASLGEVADGEQYNAFPGFFFPVVQEALAADGSPAAFDFTHRINMIPDHPPVFSMSGDFVWKVYGQILADKQLAPSKDVQQGFAKRFAAALAQMGDGELTITENSYYPTNILPSDIDDASGWTSVALDRQTIENQAVSLPGREQSWMGRFNTLPVLGDDLIESMTFERMVLVVLRPWYDHSIFGLRYWKLDSAPISDGGDPPKGVMPGVVTKLVVLRNLKLKLAAARLPDIGPTIMYRRIGGADTAEVSRAAQLVQLSASDVQPLMLANPLRADGGPVAAQVEALAAESIGETGAVATETAATTAINGAQKFHVPFSFDTVEARKIAQAELDAANATLASRLGAHGASSGQLEAVRLDIAKLEAKPRRGSFFRMAGLAKLDIAKWKFNAAALEQLLATSQQALGEAQQEQLRCQRAVQLLDQIDAIKADERAYVLSLVCDRVPKAPDPDPALFGQG